MDANLMNNPYYVKAIEYIQSTDLNSLENGKHFIEGDNLFVNIVDSKRLRRYYKNIGGEIR